MGWRPIWPAAPTTRTDRGEGFCVFNDAAVTTRSLQNAGTVKRVAIIDCDVHQGNGTADILSNQTDVFTCSLHGARNFPFEKAQSHLRNRHH
jgi:acetoin utilization deacetylase AcuC-like enzyme